MFTRLVLTIIFIASCEQEGLNLPNLDASVVEDVPPTMSVVDVSRGSDTTMTSDTPADSSTLLQPDAVVDVGRPDLTTPPADTFVSKTDTAKPDLGPGLSLGSICKANDECGSGYCTDSYCCQVSKCVSDCVPTKTTTCPTYTGCVCEPPYGTCRCYTY